METTTGWENWYRHVGRDWSKVIIGETSDPRYKPLAGQSLAEMARSRNEDPWETFFNLSFFLQSHWLCFLPSWFRGLWVGSLGGSVVPWVLSRPQRTFY